MIYHVICSRGADYIGETIRNSEIRWNEHITVKDQNSDCVKHLNNHFDHEFRWFVLSHASKNCLKSKILEAHYIKTCQPSLINQINSDLLKLFRNADLKINVRPKSKIVRPNEKHTRHSVGREKFEAKSNARSDHASV